MSKTASDYQQHAQRSSQNSARKQHVSPQDAHDGATPRNDLPKTRHTEEATNSTLEFATWKPGIQARTTNQPNPP
jgi:hypothetical protein